MLEVVVPPFQPARVVKTLLGLVFGLVCGLGCGTTTDSLGLNRSLGDGGMTGDAGPKEVRRLLPLTGPASYPNVFVEVLGVSEGEVEDKLEEAFRLLFFGDPQNEAVFFPFGTDSANILDTLHGDVRSEGIGWGMLASVELDHRSEFDQLWTFARNQLRYPSGELEGYFASYCDLDESTFLCADPYGHQTMTMALIFAHGRWGSASGRDYEADAWQMLDVMRGARRVVADAESEVTEMFDPETRLVYDIPERRVGKVGRPSIAMPAYYELWAQATDDPFWLEAAYAARVYLSASAYDETGLVPLRAPFDIQAPLASEIFVPECFRTFLNLTLDSSWFPPKTEQILQANAVLRFFESQGLDVYGQSYTLDGTTCLEPNHDVSLIAANGTLAQIASSGHRRDFIQAIWDVTPLIGTPRYYANFLRLWALMSLSGTMRVY